MINPDAKALATEPLLALRVRTDSNVSIAGHATAIFTLPKSQIGGRGFAIQLFHESIGKHDKHTDTYFGSYAKSTMKDDTLRFELSLPPITVKKDEIWLFVLYGDEQPELSPSPATSGSPAASSSPMANGSSAASASPVPSPT